MANQKIQLLNQQVVHAGNVSSNFQLEIFELLHRIEGKTQDLEVVVDTVCFEEVNSTLGLFFFFFADKNMAKNDDFQESFQQSGILIDWLISNQKSLIDHTNWAIRNLEDLNQVCFSYTHRSSLIRLL